MQRIFKSTPEITSGSMADIAFLLLIFFLVTTTIDVDYGISTNISKPFDVPDSLSLEVSTLVLNQQGAMLLDDKDVKFNDLSQKIAEDFNNQASVKNVLLVKSERNVDYELFISALNESKKGFKVFYDRMAREKYNSTYVELSDSNKVQLKLLHPVSLAEDVIEL